MILDAATRQAALKQQRVMDYFGIKGDDDMHVDVLWRIMFKMQSLESSIKFMDRKHDDAMGRIRKLEDGKKDKWCK